MADEKSDGFEWILRTGPRLSRAELEALPPRWERGSSEAQKRALRETILKAARKIGERPPSIHQAQRDKLARILRSLRKAERMSLLLDPWSCDCRQQQRRPWLARELLSYFKTAPVKSKPGRPNAGAKHHELAQHVHAARKADPAASWKTIYGRVAAERRGIKDRTIREAYRKYKDVLEWIDAAERWLREVADN